MTGVCLTIDGREVVVDVGDDGYASFDAVTIDGDPVRLTAEQRDDATDIATFRWVGAVIDIPEVW